MWDSHSVSWRFKSSMKRHSAFGEWFRKFGRKSLQWLGVRPQETRFLKLPLITVCLVYAVESLTFENSQLEV